MCGVGLRFVVHALASERLEAVTLHDVDDALRVGRATGSHDGANIAEKLGAEHAGSDGDQEPRSIGAAIDELVYGPPWNKERQAGRECTFATFDHERACTGQTVDGSPSSTGLGSLPAASLCDPVLGRDPRPTSQRRGIIIADATASRSHFRPETILHFR